MKNLMWIGLVLLALLAGIYASTKHHDPQKHFHNF